MAVFDGLPIRLHFKGLFWLLDASCTTGITSGSQLLCLFEVWLSHCTAKYILFLIFRVHSCHDYAVTKKSHKGHLLSAFSCRWKVCPFLAFYTSQSHRRHSVACLVYPPWHLSLQLSRFLIMDASCEQQSRKSYKAVKTRMWQLFFCLFVLWGSGQVQ